MNETKKSRNQNRSKNKQVELVKHDLLVNPTESSLYWLRYWDNKAGIYFISNEYSATDYFLVKVGKSINLKNRLDSYLLPYPRGYRILSVITCNKRAIGKLELSVHAYLKSKGRHARCDHTRCEEWFWLSVADIMQLNHLWSDFPGVSKLFVFENLQLVANPTYGNHFSVTPFSPEEVHAIETKYLNSDNQNHNNQYHDEQEDYENYEDHKDNKENSRSSSFQVNRLPALKTPQFKLYAMNVGQVPSEKQPVKRQTRLKFAYSDNNDNNTNLNNNNNDSDNNDNDDHTNVLPQSLHMAFDSPVSKRAKNLVTVTKTTRTKTRL